MSLIVETILVSLGLMGVEAAVKAASEAGAAGKSPAEIAAAAAAKAPNPISAAKVKAATSAGMDAKLRVGAAREGTSAALESHTAKTTAAEAAAGKKWFGRGGRVGRLAGGGLTALFALSMLPMVLDMFKGHGEEGAPAGGGGGEADLLGLLTAMQGAGEGGDVDLRSLFNQSNAAADMATRRQLLGSMPSSLGNRAAGLDEIIRGNQDLLGQIAYSEPMSVAQAYARHGLYGGPDQTRVNFQDLM